MSLLNRVAEFTQHVFNEILAEYSSFVGTRESCVELIRQIDTENIFEAKLFFFFNFKIYILHDEINILFI